MIILFCSKEFIALIIYITGELNNRKVLVRLHNVEYEYYHELIKIDQ